MYWSRGLFLRMVQPESRFRNLKHVDGTMKSLGLVLSGSVNSKADCWPNTSSRQIIAAAHTETSARLGEISHFEFQTSWQSSTAFGFAVIPLLGLTRYGLMSSTILLQTIFGFGCRWQLLYRCLSRFWPHGVLHQKMRRLRNLQFLCSLWQLGFFLNGNFSSFKTPPGLHSVAKCFAASAQHSCLWKNKTLKTAETLYESIFSSMRF